MKKRRIPNFKYYYESLNENVIVANIRTNEAIRRYYSRPAERTIYNSKDWEEMSNNVILRNEIFRITRSQARDFIRDEIIPYNHNLL